MKGIFALARQWKCFLAGTEKGEVAFYGSSSLKRRVVGRGVLTQRDRAILLREERASRQEDTPLNLKVPGITETVHESPVFTNVDQSKDQGLYCFYSPCFYFIIIRSIGFPTGAISYRNSILFCFLFLVNQNILRSNRPMIDIDFRTYTFLRTVVKNLSHQMSNNTMN